MKKVIAIIGRPNVGKSTLFNKLTGRRTAIVDDVPGVTRDRLYGETDWNGQDFTLIDTAGIERGSDSPQNASENINTPNMLKKMRAQAQIAIESADVILLVVDIKTGLVAADKEVADILQKSGKPVALCVNKCDNIGALPLDFYEFYNLGLGEPYAVSAVHGHGTGDLLDAVIELMPINNSNAKQEYPPEGEFTSPVGGISTKAKQEYPPEGEFTSPVGGISTKAKQEYAPKDGLCSSVVGYLDESQTLQVACSVAEAHQGWALPTRLGTPLTPQLSSCKTRLQSDSDEENQITKIAIIGKPNAGKSSLVNQIAGEERSIVSDVAGTTRDAVDTIIERTLKSKSQETEIDDEGNKHTTLTESYETESFLLIDTAGIRRKSRVTKAGEDIEHYSVLRALSAIDRADVCVIMVDAHAAQTSPTGGTEFSEQDKKIAGYAHEKGKASVIAVNKWDLVEKNNHTMSAFKRQLAADFAFMSYSPIAFISAKTGQRIDEMFNLCKETLKQNSTRIGTGRLNDMLAYATARVQPPTDRGKRLKLYYITQASVNPPTFVIFCNKLELFHFSYQRYIENQIREAFELDKTPIRIIPRERGDD